MPDFARLSSGAFGPRYLLGYGVFQDKAGTDESVRVAREWIAKNADNLGAAPPAILEGTVILQMKSFQRQASASPVFSDAASEFSVSESIVTAPAPPSSSAAQVHDHRSCALAADAP